ncbi:hypothetical protein ACIBKY_17450 [Nonomuraea sp. NPDC050394]|uniref:hypothetical protein n=1 Tax=Nonomuraea sp. NPDC050394 TaxID=3364363 RepID=UPI0037B57B3D
MSELARLTSISATDALIEHLAETVRQRLAHEHPQPGGGEDLFCLNLTSYMGERMGAVLVRLREAEARLTSAIVLEPPAELGIQWEDGGDLLALTSDGIVLTPRGVDVWELDPAEARELAAQLAAMADAHEAAGRQT